jgi:predicted Zn-dependent peptidase
MTKRQLHGSIVIAQESVSGRMYHMARQELYTGRYTSSEEQVERILAVTREDVAALAAEFLRPERFALGALGPAHDGPLTEADWAIEAVAS